MSAVVLLASMGFVNSVLAQAGGGGGGGGQFDPAQFRQRMMDRLKEQLGASDDEWKAIQPKVEKVMDAQRDARSGGGGFFFGGGRGGPGGGRGGPGGGGGGGRGGPGGTPGEQTAVGKAMADLRSALDEKSTPADEIAKRLATLRDVREKARKSLADSQKDLKDLLTQRQEAVLVMAGMLE
jgi:hypothetical protein